MSDRFGRGEFLRRALGWMGRQVVEHVTDSVAGMPPGRVRPPGALPEASFLLTCHRCKACINACPPRAIRPLPTTTGLAAGTPAIDPVQVPCELCPDTPCISACPSGALSPLEQVMAARMGLAELRAESCLNSQERPCDFCVTACPVPGALTMGETLPAVDASVCTGCGICVHVCPTQPKALRLVPIGS